MYNLKKIIILSLLILNSCGDPNKEVSNELKGDDLEIQMIDAYKEGVKALEKGDVLFASKKFNEAELLFPQSEWASKASLMSSYAYWTQGYYSDAIGELKRFTKLYSNHKNLDYAYYLLAICYYDSILNEKKDLKPLVEAERYFKFIIKEYPESDYALDAKYKLELIKDILAAKEMFIARHYIKKEKWIAAINRLKNILEDYDTTMYVEEALHRLVEVYYIIGLEGESQKYAKTLGYNYQSSEWYKESYRIFNKDYIIEKKVKKKTKRKKLTDRIKSFF
jgi:outer membrane protein assembly factor BamD